ncbi:MAG: PHP domain-containing protein, partial [Bacteroidales bacterium]|nr:PHP domain-containing protein [Bacteroidales bacterium]
MVLAAKSYYSLRYGVLSVDNLVKIAKFKGHTAFGMADINNTSGIFDFIKACQKNNIKAIVGMEFHQDNEFLYLIVVKNQKGFHLMNKLYSDAQIHKRKLASSPPLSEHYFTIYNINTCPNLLKNNEFIGIRSYDLSQMHQLLKKYPKEKMLILHQGFYLSQEHYQIHKHLRAIHFNTLLNHLIEEQIAHPFDKIPEKDAFVQFFKAYPFLIENTEKLNEECNFEFDYKKNKNLKVFSDSEENDIIKLRELTNVGMIKRFGRENAEAQKRIENELKTIKNLNFVSYFLITWDIIRFAKSQNIHHVGRGSGANSIVAYCLGIT